MMSNKLYDKLPQVRAGHPGGRSSDCDDRANNYRVLDWPASGTCKESRPGRSAKACRAQALRTKQMITDDPALAKSLPRCGAANVAVVSGRSARA
jgi:hypothetical protein